MKAAAYLGTRNVYADMIPAVKSLLANSDVDKIYLLIEDDDFPYELPKCVECINVSNQEYFDRDGINFNNRWTYMILLKAALFRIFPDLDKIVCLDVDTIVDDDVSDLWDIDISNYYVAGAKEPWKSKNCLYINAGVMVMNLAKLRDGRGDSIIRELNTKKYTFCEQDCINLLCRGEMLEIPSFYNANNYTEPTTKPKIVHFAAVPAWQNAPLVSKYREMDWHR